MKKNEHLEIPDSIFGLFGISLPCHTENRAEEYQKGSSVTDYLNTGRIITLKKEDRYQRVLPKLEDTGMLNLNLKNIPDNDYQKADCLKKAIRKMILKLFKEISTTEGSTEEGALLQSLMGCYGKDITIEHVFHSETKGAKLAAAVFGQDDFYLLRYCGTKENEIYGTLFGKNIRMGKYYFFKKEPGFQINVMNFADFLADLFLLQELNRIQLSGGLPLVECYFADYVDSERGQGILPSNRQLALEAIEAKQPIPLDVMLKEKNEHCYVSMGSDLLCVLSVLFLKIHSLYQDISYEVRERAEHAKHIATAYMTKKNIPQNVQQCMNETSFMHFFQFVEFDEDVDLSSVEAIEKEFLIINKAYFSNLRYPTVSLRFRKLGKHKASGLYYPDLDTLCVDIRSPASFIHEFFHMIDDQLGDLSLFPDFEPLVEEYKKEFNKGLINQDAKVKETLRGNTKYNRAYFFRRAEIFARCGEIYFSRILKVDSPLVKPDLSFAYPQSEKLDGLIAAYYSNLLEKRLSESGLKPAI